MNYIVKDKRYIRDIKCEVTYYEHRKTGARVIVMPAEDTNRAISIAFSTPSENSKGIAHIIEHSVLCGSDKYPLKDPFVQLMKGSMYSFLNAMTFSDFTMYPVASTNEKDFQNLAGVYLDAAFRPLLPHKKEVFLQEGHHFELDENGEVKGFNGVVFNEMKGAEGSVDMHIENAVAGALFEGTPYAFESGGLPLDIADLSYEELCDFYHRHYTASNAVIFLYGKIDTEAILQMIDEEYLSRYEKTERFVIPAIDSRPYKEVTAPYPADETDLEKGHYFSYDFALHLPHTPLNYLTLRVLDRILCTSQGAVIKNALQKAGIGEDFYSTVDELIRCPHFGFVAAKCKESEKDTFKKIIDTELTQLVENGIDKDKLLSAIRVLEFQEKEESSDWTPKGITFAIQALAPFLYEEENPLLMLEFFDAIDELKVLAEGDYFEQFIRQYFLENSHKAFATVYPDTEFSAREDSLLAEKCAAQLQSLNLEDVKADFALLNAYRYSEDTEEDAEKIPLLERSDLSETPEETPVEIIDTGKNQLYFDLQATNDIAYFYFLFDLRRLPTELLPYVRIFIELVGAMDTKEHSYAALSDLIDNYTGELAQSYIAVDGNAFDRPLVPYLFWHSRFLYENADQVAALNREILLDTDFSDTAHIKDLLLQLKSSLTRNLLETSHITVRSLGLAAYSKKYAFDETVTGYGFYRFLCDLLDHYEERKDDIVNAMESIRHALMQKDAWCFSYIGERHFLEKAKEYTDRFAALLTADGDAEEQLAFPALSAKKPAAYASPSQVQYDALCGLLPEAAKEQRGIALVAAHLLSTAYLWQNVRVLGGAYGCFATFERNGEASMISYRDPNLDKTLETFRKSADFLKTLDVNERTLRQYIIGAMNKLDKPKTPYEKGLTAVFSLLLGKTLDYDTAVRKQIIRADLADVNAFGELLAQWIDGATVTVIGNEQKIKEADTAFAEINTLL